MTVAHEIKSPLKSKPTKLWPQGYRNTLVTIWHVDPCQGHHDDSCGFCFPRLTDEQIKQLKGIAWSESYGQFFLRSKTQRFENLAEAAILARLMVDTVATTLDIKLTADQRTQLERGIIHDHHDTRPGTGYFCFLPGWHTNHADDRREDREEYILTQFCGLARDMLRMKRPWYRHPRWHVHHWRFQVHHWQQLRRWLFDRCEGCDKPFPWGYSPIGVHWHQPPTRWFRSAVGLFHHECSPDRRIPPVDESQPAEHGPAKAANA